MDTLDAVWQKPLVMGYLLAPERREEVEQARTFGLLGPPGIYQCCRVGSTAFEIKKIPSSWTAKLGGAISVCAGLRDEPSRGSTTQLRLFGLSIWRLGNVFPNTSQLDYAELPQSP